jgi:hypothetical protein
MLIGIANNETNRSACGLTLEDTAEQFHLVFFLSSSGQHALTRFTTSQFALYKSQIYFDASRHAIDNSTDGWTMTFAK